MTPLSLAYRSGVGVMIINRTGLIFVGQRRDNPGAAWQMPQGGIEEGETPEQAMARELEEETGLTLDDVDILRCAPRWLCYDLPGELISQLWDGQYRGQRQLWFLLRSKDDGSRVNVAAAAEPEFSDWRWVTPEELRACAVPFKRALYGELLEIFSSDLAR